MASAGASRAEDSVDPRVEPAIRSLFAGGEFGFRRIRAKLVQQLGRPLRQPEKALLTSLIHARHDDDGFSLGSTPSAPVASSWSQTKPTVLMFTAFSTNYVVGHVCAAVNEAYAAQHGYGWLCETPCLQEMMQAIHPRGHGTWYKVAMINRLLSQQHSVSSSDHDTASKPLTTLIERASGKDLVIAEDMTQNCLINAGVMLIRCSAWSRALWSDLWTQSWVRRYWSQQPYEQAALLRWLESHQEELQLQRGYGNVDTSTEKADSLQSSAKSRALAPFHSFCGGPRIKCTRHLYVLPHDEFNTNRGDWYAANNTAVADNETNDDIQGLNPSPHADVSLCARSAGNHEQCTKIEQSRIFIFHAVGLPKLRAVIGMLQSADKLGYIACSVVTIVERQLQQLRTLNPRYVIGKPLRTAGPDTGTPSEEVKAFAATIQGDLAAGAFTLQCIDLSSNRLNDCDIKFLAPILASCCVNGLRSLHLAHNRISLSGAQYLGGALSDAATETLASSLVSLDLRCQALDEVQQQNLAANQTNELLELLLNGFSKTGSDTIASWLRLDSNWIPASETVIADIVAKASASRCKLIL